MKLKVIDGEFTVCKVSDLSAVNFSDSYCFVGKTDQETSLVCRTASAPDGTLEREDGWQMFRVEGTLDFSLTGILAKIAGILAEQKIGIFAVSTFNTDYILTKAENFSRALEALEKQGYELLK